MYLDSGLPAANGSREENQTNIKSSSSGILAGHVQSMLRRISTAADTQPRIQETNLTLDLQ
jgi:hypothetical protein